MRRVLLVDDETLVRTNIKLMLNEYDSIISICGEASNGKEALDLIESTNPQIIVSDMKMPEMDGLSLCKTIHEKYPDIVYIALSNYDDYDYVRGALRNGAADYLLKHELKAESLSELLCNLTLPSKVDTISSGETTENNLIALRKKFVLYLLNGLYSSMEEIDTNIKMLSIHLDSRQIVPIILSVDNYFQLVENGSLKKRSLIEFSVVNISNEILSNFSNGVLSHISNSNFCILLSFDGIHSESAIETIIRTILQQLSSNLLTYLNISVSFSIGTRCGNASELPQSYEKAENALNSKLYAGNHAILRSKDILKSENPLAGLDYNLEKKLSLSAGVANADAVHEILDQLFSDMMKKRLSITNAQMVFTDLIGVITRTCKENGIELKEIFQGNIQPNELMIKLTTLSQIKKWFLQSFDQLCKNLHNRVSADSDYVCRAIACINRDYCKYISQTTVADEIGISSGYLSTIFKNETDLGFSEYVTSLRISKVQALLEAGENDFHEIAMECGFQDYSYFFKVFKKKLGMTPKEYIKKKHI